MPWESAQTWSANIRAGGRPLAAELALEQLEPPPRHISHQRIAIAEMTVGCGRAYAGGARRFGEGEARGPLGGDKIEGGADQGFAQIAVMIAAALLVPRIPMPAHVNSSYMSPALLAAILLVVRMRDPAWRVFGAYRI